MTIDRISVILQEIREYIAKNIVYRNKKFVKVLSETWSEVDK